MCYQSSQNLHLSINSKTICEPRVLAPLRAAIFEMLNKEPEKRPNASRVREILDSINGDTFPMSVSVYVSVLRFFRLLQLVLTRSTKRIPLLLLFTIGFLVLGAVVCVTTLFWSGIFAVIMELFYPQVCKIVFEETAHREAISQWLSYESCCTIQELNYVVLDLWKRVR